MQLKAEANTEPRKKFHMTARLRKAVHYAEELVALCQSPKCDARTKLECEVCNLKRVHLNIYCCFLILTCGYPFFPFTSASFNKELATHDDFDHFAS